MERSWIDDQKEREAQKRTEEYREMLLEKKK